MRVIITVRDALARASTDVLVDAEPGTPLTQIVRAIRSRLGGGEGQTADDHSGATFAESGLMDGAVLTIGESHASPPQEGLVELRFVAGPGSGRIRRLTVGHTTIGIDEQGGAVFGVQITGSALASVLLGLDGTVIIRATGEDALLLEQAELGSEPVVWLAGAQLQVGRSVLTAHPPTLGDAELIRSPDEGWLDYNRPPRLLPPVPANRFRYPAPPVAPTKNSLPWITAMIPALLGVSMAVMLRQPFYLLFALMSPVMMIGSNLSSRRNGKKSHRRLLAEHKKTMESIAEEVAEAVAAEQRRRRRTTPDAAELLLAATAPTRRLWERRNTDPDHLLVRVGSADLPSTVQLEDMAELEHRRLSTGMNRAVPATLSISEAGVIGIAGREDWARAVGKWMIGQLAVLQSPRDLQLCILASPDTLGAWDWALWLPHLRPALGQDALALTGADSDSLGRRVAELGQLVAERTKASSAAGSASARHAPDVLVVLDGARRLRAMPGIVTLLRDGPGVGVHLLCLEEEERQLPEECTAVIVERSEGTLLLKQHNADDIDGVLADVVSDDWFEAMARSLAPMRDVSPSDSDSLLPTSANLLEVLGLGTPTGRAVAERWSRGGRTTEAVIGISLDGPFAIDLVRDGPHGLVAGTTGSGKSEFLQTLVASLAAANRPDAMTFVLIDYKGGAAFSECADLPHTVGLVTDLDTHLVQRALGSLRAELIRREEILGAVGAKDLETYYAHLSLGGRGENLPRLAIVIDEFAAMAKELPDFVAGLVGIAQRGRSLGVHLVMATQRPSGVISPEIRANTNLRVALRMTDAGESSDVIDIPDAARISKAIPGRAYARLGHASIIPFQAARVGGTARIETAEAATRAPFVARLSRELFSAPVPRAPRADAAATTTTELSLLVAAIREATELLAIEPQHSPWLAPLPETVSLETLHQTPSGAGIDWAREDIPSAQRQQNAAIDLDRFGHLYVVGAPGSGRSGALRTIAASAAASASVADLHLYGIDCGNGALSSLAALPHCGAVAQRNQAERAARLIQRLEAEVLRRHELLGAGSHANIAEQRLSAEPGQRLPHILVLIDRWENFVSTLGELDGGALTDSIHSLLRDGASAGVHLVIAGDRSLLTSRMSVLCDDKVILRLTDRLDYSLADLNHKTLPTEVPPGRGFRSGSGIELQIALVGDDPSGQAQSEAVRSLGRELAAKAAVPVASLPFRVDDLPSILDLEQALLLTDETPGPMWALVGVGGDRLLAHGIDLEHDAPTFIVAGPSRSGRSSLLAVMANSLLRAGSQLVLACPRSSPLRELAGTPGVRALFTHTELTEADLAPHLDPDGTPVVLIVDDGEMLMDAPAKAWLRGFIRAAGDNRRGLILGGNSAELCAGFSGWQVDVKKNRRGALLSPQNTIDGDLLGVRLARSAVSPKVVPGRAVAHLGSGELVTLQIPAPAIVT
ncbi:FtsK/SpoIIIE domain-containing protein [Lacisediminihabitans sp.]|uniref:FtsK/SpoIIIE domain-containing protein n=1 Tax=Lacisediminihabitans sp. TaxID=2787631 RepID=UPI00374D760E